MPVSRAVEAEGVAVEGERRGGSSTENPLNPPGVVSMVVSSVPDVYTVHNATRPDRTTERPASTARSTYRHGDLRQALLEAGVAMAREGGPDAVVLREATRRAGVSPNAAYRHFSDREALVTAVSDAALGARRGGHRSRVGSACRQRRGRRRPRSAPSRRRNRVPALRPRRAGPVPRRLHACRSNLDRGLQPRQGRARRPHARSSCSRIALDELVAAGRSCPPSGDRAPSCSPGRPCTGSRCSCSRGRCATSTPTRAPRPDGGSSTWSCAASSQRPAETPRYPDGTCVRSPPPRSTIRS